MENHISISALLKEFGHEELKNQPEDKDVLKIKQVSVNVSRLQNIRKKK